jgi:hypothetical protein
MAFKVHSFVSGRFPFPGGKRTEFRSVPRQGRIHKITYNPRGDHPVLEPIQNAVEGKNRSKLELGLHFSRGGTCKRCHHILAIAHKRASNSDAIRYNIE